jgi:hypothetical protein
MSERRSRGHADDNHRHERTRIRLRVSAFGWKGAPREVLERTLNGEYHLVTCPEQLEELERVLSYPKLVITHDQRTLFLTIIRTTASIPPYRSRRLLMTRATRCSSNSPSPQKQNTSSPEMPTSNSSVPCYADRLTQSVFRRALTLRSRAGYVTGLKEPPDSFHHNRSTRFKDRKR